MKVVAFLQYTKIRDIGKGHGMNSEVFLAEDPQLGGEIAIKEIPKTSFGGANFFAEAQCMFQSAHANVVPVLYGSQTADKICLGMRYFKNGSLAMRIATDPLPLSEVVRVGLGVLHGVAHIHMKGFIHFDIKPSNILFSDADIPMVADFGQSRAIGPTGIVTAPPLYKFTFPPEVLSSPTADLTADIYHCGVLLYRAVNGNPHYKAQVDGLTDAELGDAIANGHLPHRQKFLPHVPNRIRSLIRKALSLKPTERFQSATEMADALGRIPIPLNWRTTARADGGFDWRADRPGQSSLTVTLKAEGAGRWAIETHSVMPGETPRAKQKKDFWRKGIRRAAADAHLKTVFQELAAA